MHCTLLTIQSMALAFNIIHGHVPNNKMRPQLQSKKAVLAIDIVAKGIIYNVHY